MAGQNTSHTDSRITIRFNETDADLREWLGQFAATHDMSKVIKLACYLLSGIDPDEGLLALLPNIQDKQVTQPPDAPKAEEQESTSDMFAAMMQEIAAIRAAVEQREETTIPAEESIPVSDSRRRRQQKRAPDTSPLPPNEHDQEPEPVVAASGLNMSRERRRTGPPQVISVPEPVPHVDTEEASKQFLATINAFGRELRRGH
jgi:hypothetical protein